MRAYPSLPRVFLDTNMLYGELETDVLLSLASKPRATFIPFWSDYVEMELRRHLPERLVALGESGNVMAGVEKRLNAMDRFFPEAKIQTDPGISKRVLSMVSDKDDAPILAGAVQANADRLITMNIKDFDIDAISRRLSIQVEQPIPFLEELQQRCPNGFFRQLTDMVSHHLYPPRTLEELADMSERSYLRGLGGILEREMERQHVAARAARPASGAQGRDRLGRFTAKPGSAADLPDPTHGIWGPDGNGWR